jgi:hypothetical protein
MTLGPAISKGTQTAPGCVRFLRCRRVPVAPSITQIGVLGGALPPPASPCLPSDLVTRALFPSLVPHATRIVPTPIFLSGFTYSVVLYGYRVGTSESRPVGLSDGMERTQLRRHSSSHDVLCWTCSSVGAGP